MKIINDHTKFCRSPDQIFSEIDDEIVMLSVRNGEYYNLNKVASMIWNHFDSPKSFDSLVSVLQNEFNVSKIECEQDAKQFIFDLIEKGLINVSSDEDQ